MYYRYKSRLLIIVPFTILVYEYILTLEREVSRFWGIRLTWGTFFYLNRYSSRLGTVPIVVKYYSTTDPDKMPVNPLRAYNQYFALISQVLVAVILIMRTFAPYERQEDPRIHNSRRNCSFYIGCLQWLLTTGNAITTLSPAAAVFGCPIGTCQARLGTAWSGMVFSSINARRGDLLTILIRDGVVMIISNARNIGTYTVSVAFDFRTKPSLTMTLYPDGWPVHKWNRDDRNHRHLFGHDLAPDAEPAGPHHPDAEE
ncbi:hypothetical protein C8R44DRAFT_806654 [Mycena epipterygia]|nr:hypothetical protein C8R44DRAFT_806654 [Mycena epipterygia]